MEAEPVGLMVDACGGLRIEVKKKNGERQITEGKKLKFTRFSVILTV